MKIIYNKFIPFKGYIAINIFGIIFVRSEYRYLVNKQLLNHEEIHTAQANDFCKFGIGYIIFYILYLLEFLIRFLINFNLNKSYSNISFEQEAYDNDSDLNYLNTRKKFKWIHYIFKNK